MIEPFKVCPYCGQRAVLSMLRCGRCGAPYPAPTGIEQYPVRRQRSAWSIILLLALPVAVLAFLAFRQARKGGPSPSASLTSQSRIVKAGAPVAEAGEPPPSGRGSLFTE